LASSPVNSYGNLYILPIYLPFPSITCQFCEGISVEIEKYVTRVGHYFIFPITRYKELNNV